MLLRLTVRFLISIVPMKNGPFFIEWVTTQSARFLARHSRVSGLDVLQRVRHDVRLHHLTGVYSHHLRHIPVLLLHLTPPTGQQGGVPTNQLYNLQQYQPAVQPATRPTSCTTCNNTNQLYNLQQYQPAVQPATIPTSCTTCNNTNQLYNLQHYQPAAQSATIPITSLHPQVSRWGSYQPAVQPATVPTSCTTCNNTNQLFNLQQYQPAVQPTTLPTSCTICNNTNHITPPTGQQVGFLPASCTTCNSANQLYKLQQYQPHHSTHRSARWGSYQPAVQPATIPTSCTTCNNTNQLYNPQHYQPAAQSATIPTTSLHPQVSRWGSYQPAVQAATVPTSCTSCNNTYHITPPTGQQGGVPTNQLYNLQQYQPAAQSATIPTTSLHPLVSRVRFLPTSYSECIPLF